MIEKTQDTTTLFVQELDEQRNSLQVTPIDLSADGDCRVGQPVSFALPPEDDQGAAPRVVTASTGNSFFLARRDPRQPDRAVLKHFEAWQVDPQVETIELGGLQPISLLAVGSRCFLGAVGTIHRLDCDLGDRTPSDLVTPPDGTEAGAFDALCTAGLELIAIFDRLESRSVWVISDPLGPRPQIRLSSRLPSLQGERIREAAASQTKLVVRTTFYHRGTAGQRLLLFDLTADALVVTAQAMEIRGAGLFKRGHSRLAGLTHSPWQGLDLLGDRVLIGAAERGILICHTGMRDEDRAQRLDPGGACLDLKVVGDQVLALVARKKDGRGRIDLAVLAANDDPKHPLQVLTSHPLPGKPERIAP